MSEWQPISTVPINTRVLVYAPSSKYVKVFEATAYPDGQFFDPVYTEWDGGGATHWMPLPSPPKPVDKQGTGS